MLVRRNNTCPAPASKFINPISMHTLAGRTLYRPIVNAQHVGLFFSFEKNIPPALQLIGKSLDSNCEDFSESFVSRGVMQRYSNLTALNRWIKALVGE